MAAAVLTLVSAVFAGDAHARSKAPQIVITYCSGCHGVDGNSTLPYFPKLAGLDASYADKKLAEFKEIPSPPVEELYRRTRSVFAAKSETENITRNERINMEGVAHAASPAVINEAVVWYARQPSRPGRSGNKTTIEAGRNLFTKGLPTSKVLACVACHGPDAQGMGKAPRLAGQNAEYIEGQLAKFRKGDRRHAPEMTIVTRDLDREQALTVAAYLQSR
jgi:cytochrome c553